MKKDRIPSSPSQPMVENLGYIEQSKYRNPLFEYIIEESSLIRASEKSIGEIFYNAIDNANPWILPEKPEELKLVYVQAIDLILTLTSRPQSPNQSPSTKFNPLFGLIRKKSKIGSVRELVYYAIRDINPQFLPTDPECLKQIIVDAIDEAVRLKRSTDD